jgi:hypothetical protein
MPPAEQTMFSVASSGYPQPSPPSPAMLAHKWRALAPAGTALAAHAALEADHAVWPCDFSQASDHQRQLVWQGLDDCAAMITAGLTALDALVARGSDPRVPALTLWEEFRRAHGALLGTAQPSDSLMG